MKITFVLPGHSVKPAGGPKMVFEYANRLVRLGHAVTVVHPQTMATGSTTWNSRTLSQLKYCARRLGLRGGYRPQKWFAVDPSVKLLWVPDLHHRHIPDADVIVATYWQTAEVVASLPDSKGVKHYLIQHDERVWDDISKERIAATWKLPLNKIVIAKWLIDIVRDGDGPVTYIPYGMSFDVFGIDMPIAQRPSHHVIMLYHQQTFKGSAVGIRALELAKNAIDDLRASVFGVDARPTGLPAWIDYHSNPRQLELRSLYNRAAIYIGPSLSEGWGLTGCEAAQCGDALCMTNVGGHREYAIPGETALLCEPGDPESLAKNIVTLIRDDVLRIKLAEAAHQYVRRFNWDDSVDKIEGVFRASVAAVKRTDRGKS